MKKKPWIVGFTFDTVVWAETESEAQSVAADNRKDIIGDEAALDSPSMWDAQPVTTHLPGFWGTDHSVAWGDIGDDHMPLQHRIRDNPELQDLYRQLMQRVAKIEADKAARRAGLQRSE